MPLALIVGAGIGGLAAGIALRRCGWDIRIFERADAPRELGFGVGIAPNAVAALREIGVADAVTPHIIFPTSAEIRHFDGRVIRHFGGVRRDHPSIGLPGLIMRPALHGALLDAVGAAAITVNSEAAGFTINGGKPLLRLADGTTVAGDVLVGADGVGSTIRAQLHPDEPPPRPSGYFALRGASPAIARLNGLQAIWYFGDGIEAGVVQASSRTIYWFLSLLAEDVRRGPMDSSSILRRFGARFDEQFHAITSATPPDHLRVDELFERDPLANWGAGPVTLLGDAAHPMLPHTGQGAAQALEDAAGLGRAIRHTTDPIAALRHYERVRGGRTRAVVVSGPRIARVTTTKSRPISAMRNGLIRLVPLFVLVKLFTRRVGDPNEALGRP